MELGPAILWRAARVGTTCWTNACSGAIIARHSPCPSYTEEVEPGVYIHDAPEDRLVARPRQPGLDDRHRDQNGQIRAKNGNTRLDTLRRSYGEDFGAGHRGDMKLENFLADEGYRSLTQALKDQGR